MLANRISLLLIIAILLSDSGIVLNSGVAGDLSSIKKSTKGSSSDDDDDDKKKKRKQPKRRHHQHCDDDGSGDFVFKLIGAALSTAIENSSSGEARPTLRDRYGMAYYPYCDGAEGLILINPDPDQVFESQSVRFFHEYANDFSGLQRYGGRVHYDRAHGVGFDTEWNHWWEDTPTGTDTLLTGDANFLWRLGNGPRGQLYWGLGMNWMAGSHDDIGFNFTTGFEWFPSEPVVVRSFLDMGTLGDADLYHSETTVGLIYNRFEVFTGYDITHIGDSNLQGVIGGFNIWW